MGKGWRYGVRGRGAEKAALVLSGAMVQKWSYRGFGAAQACGIWGGKCFMEQLLCYFRELRICAWDL